jgi:hypothetical protein
MLGVMNAKFGVVDADLRSRVSLVNGTMWLLRLFALPRMSV